MKSVWKFTFVLLLAVVGIFSVSLNTQAATKPYVYTFEKDSGNQFNGIGSINKLVITFDQDISELKTFQNNITVVPANQTNPAAVGIIKTIQTRTISGESTPRELVITFNNLNFIDYTGKLDYKLVINEGTLRFDQLETYEIPFNIYDLLPGFKSTFIDTNAATLNNNIFMNNANRDIQIHVPKIYITGITTIHHYSGILPDPTSSQSGGITKVPDNTNAQANPALTNIDVLADKDATRLKVGFGSDPQYSRDLTRRTDINGFSMGQAGINEITDNQVESATEFSLAAYNDNGRFLEQRSFKLRVADPKKDFTVSDYLPKPTKEFGQTYSLYDLMDPKHNYLEDIISQIPVSQLDSLGVTYSIGNTVSVSDENQLRLALQNPNLTTIKLPSTLTLTSDLVIDHNVTLEGVSQASPSSLTGGNVQLKGTDINVRLNNVNISGNPAGGNLTVDVGAKGTAILDHSSAAATTIVSGDVHSIHLNIFKTDSLDINNNTELRVVANGSLTKLDGTTAIPVTISGTKPVTLEGTYSNVNVASNTTLNMTENTQIANLDVAEGQTLTIGGSGKGSTSITGKGDVTFISEDGKDIPPVEMNLKGSETFSGNVSAWKSGQNVTLSGGTFSGSDGVSHSIPTDLTFEPVNKTTFGIGTEVKYDTGKSLLSIDGLDPLTLTAPLQKDIQLQAVQYQLDGANKIKTIYTITIPVVVSLN